MPNAATTISGRLLHNEHPTRIALAAVVALLGAGLVSGCGRDGHAHLRTPTAARAPATAGTSAAGATAAASAPALLLEEAKRELAAMRVSHYRHTTDVEEASGTFVYDCSGFLDYALARVLPADAKALPRNAHARPLAGDIERYLYRGLSGPIIGWQAVERAEGLAPGDVVAWQATEDSTTGDTGHVMIVLGAPTHNPVRDEWLVAVADSTISPHAADSRRPGENGLGAGTIGLVVDQRGAPTAFYWQGGISRHAKPTEIALGRPL